MWCSVSTKKKSTFWDISGFWDDRFNSNFVGIVVSHSIWRGWGWEICDNFLSISLLIEARVLSECFSPDILNIWYWNRPKQNVTKTPYYGHLEESSRALINNNCLLLQYCIERKSSQIAHPQPLPISNWFWNLSTPRPFASVLAAPLCVFELFRHRKMQNRELRYDLRF